MKCVESITGTASPPSPSRGPISDDEKSTIYLAIADCDYQLAQIEKHLYQYKKVYAYIYSCYHYRKLVLGLDNPLTKLASDMSLLHNSVQGERLLCSVELRERVTELGSTAQDTDPNVQYLKAVVNSITALDDDVSLFVEELNTLVASAVLTKAKRNRVNSDDASYSSSNQDMVDGILRLLLITPSGSASSSPSIKGRKVSLLAATMPVISTSSPTISNAALSATTSFYSSPAVSKTRSPHSSGKSKRTEPAAYTENPLPVENSIPETLPDISSYDFMSPAKKHEMKPSQHHNKQHTVVSPTKKSHPRRHRDRSKSPEKNLVVTPNIDEIDSTITGNANSNRVIDGGNTDSTDSIVVMFGDRETQYIGYDLLTKRLFATCDVKFDDVVKYQKKVTHSLTHSLTHHSLTHPSRRSPHSIFFLTSSKKYALNQLMIIVVATVLRCLLLLLRCLRRCLRLGHQHRIMENRYPLMTFPCLGYRCFPTRRK